MRYVIFIMSLVMIGSAHYDLYALSDTEMAKKLINRSVEQFLEDYVPKHPAYLKTAEDRELYFRLALNNFIDVNRSAGKNYIESDDIINMLAKLSSTSPDIAKIFKQIKSPKSSWLGGEQVSTFECSEGPFFKEFLNLRLKYYTDYLTKTFGKSWQEISDENLDKELENAKKSLTKDHAYLFAVLEACSPDLTTEEREELIKIIQKVQAKLPTSAANIEKTLKDKINDIEGKRGKVLQEIVQEIADENGVAPSSIEWNDELIERTNQEFEEEFAKEYKRSYEDYLQGVEKEIASLLQKVPKDSSPLIVDKFKEDIQKLGSFLKEDITQNFVTQEDLKKAGTDIESTFSYYGRQLKEIPGEIWKSIKEKKPQETKKSKKTTEQSLEQEIVVAFNLIVQLIKQDQKNPKTRGKALDTFSKNKEKELHERLNEIEPGVTRREKAAALKELNDIYHELQVMAGVQEKIWNTLVKTEGGASVHSLYFEIKDKKFDEANKANIKKMRGYLNRYQQNTQLIKNKLTKQPKKGQEPEQEKTHSKKQKQKIMVKEVVQKRQYKKRKGKKVENPQKKVEFEGEKEEIKESPPVDQTLGELEKQIKMGYQQH
jgi:hypothetical protein